MNYLGKWSEAEPHCIEAQSIYEEILGPNHIKVGKCLVGLGGKYYLIL